MTSVQIPTRIAYDSLVIEVTRRCNMCCAHCLRGDAQAMDISDETIDKALEGVSSIGSLSFSGGEPTLNVEAIEHTLELCKSRNIEVFGIYVVTNGKEVSERFLLAMLRWFSYVTQCGGEPECSGIALSKDKFHEPIPAENEALLRGFGFFREDKFTNFDSVPIIGEGRGAKLAGQEKRFRDYLPDVDISCWDSPEGYREICVENLIYICADGEVKCDCDAAFLNTDTLIGDLSDSSIGDILESHM